MTARCEPPQEWRQRAAHWLTNGEKLIVEKWFSWTKTWSSAGHSPEVVAELGWRYVAPVLTPAEIAEREAVLREENNKLRALLAASDKPCAYCGLDAVDIAKCPSGFPGCARMDDLMQAAETEKDRKAQDALLTAYNEAAEREAAAYERGQREMQQAAQGACREQSATFLSSEYATGQPLSSLSERFACGQCEKLIAALPIKEKPE